VDAVYFMLFLGGAGFLVGTGISVGLATSWRRVAALLGIGCATVSGLCLVWAWAAAESATGCDDCNEVLGIRMSMIVLLVALPLQLAGWTLGTLLGAAIRRTRSAPWAAVLAILVGVSGCASGEDDSPGGPPLAGDAAFFAMKVFADYGAQDFAEVWTDLHPAQQRLVPQDEFVACYAQQPGGLIPKIDGWVDEDATLEHIVVPGTSWRVRAIVVPVDVTIVIEGPYTATWHVPIIRVHGRWAWILTGPYLRDFQSGRCPGWGPPPGAVY
jgi:hypothetical protein